MSNQQASNIAIGFEVVILFHGILLLLPNSYYMITLARRFFQLQQQPQGVRKHQGWYQFYIASKTKGAISRKDASGSGSAAADAARSQRNYIRNILLALVFNELSLFGQIVATVIPSSSQGFSTIAAFCSGAVVLATWTEFLKRLVSLISAAKWTNSKVFYFQIFITITYCALFGGFLTSSDFDSLFSSNTWQSQWARLGGISGFILFQSFYIWMVIEVYTGIMKEIMIKMGSQPWKNMSREQHNSTSSKEVGVLKNLFNIWIYRGSILAVLYSIIALGLDITALSLTWITSYFFLAEYIFRLCLTFYHGNLILEIAIFEGLLEANSQMDAMIEQPKQKAREFMQKWRRNESHSSASASSKVIAGKKSTHGSSTSAGNLEEGGRILPPILGGPTASFQQRLTNKVLSPKEKQAAEEVFNKNFPLGIKLQEEKEKLKELHSEAKLIGEKANELKSKIKTIKASVQTNPNLEASKDLNQYTQEFKAACASLKEKMAKIETFQKGTEKLKTEVAKSFQQWIAQREAELAYMEEKGEEKGDPIILQVEKDP